MDLITCEDEGLKKDIFEGMVGRACVTEVTFCCSSYGIPEPSMRYDAHVYLRWRQ